jgi:hypothetical protein
MQVTDTREASRTPTLQTTVQIPVRLLESTTPSDSAAVRALFDSILRWGILQPLIVRRIAGSPRYEVLAGCKRFASALSAGFSEVPCFVFDGSEADAAPLASASNIPAAVVPLSSPTPPLPPLFSVVLSELQATRSAIAGSLRLAEPNSGGLRPRIARELVDIELHRASWLMDGLQLLNAEERRNRASVWLGPLLRSVIEAFQPECRLSAIDVQLLVDPSDLTVIGDEAELRAAVNCAIGAVLTAMHITRRTDPALSILGTATQGAVVVSIAQNVVPFQELARLRSGSRRGELPQAEGVLTHFGFECAKRAIERHGGRLELRADPATAGGAIDLKFLPVERN